MDNENFKMITKTEAISKWKIILSKQKLAHLYGNIHHQFRSMPCASLARHATLMKRQDETPVESPCTTEVEYDYDKLVATEIM